MKILEQFLLKGMPLKDKLKTYYAAVSFMAVGCLGDGTSTFIMILLLLNLANAVRLVNKINFDKYLN